MTKVSSRRVEAKPSSPSEQEPEELRELRRLIVGPVEERLSTLEVRLQDPQSRATDVSEVLPNAVTLRGPRDNRLTTALRGSVEEIIGISVRKNREILAGALSPVVSLAVRKSVSEFFQRLLQSVNETLEVSWSWRGLKWRLEAARTGKPFSEIVLLHTLEYRVEQVFLIHSETGLLIDHVFADPVVAKEPELVSGMLTAIQDFIADSFDAHLEDRLDVIASGDLSIWIENCPEALLACAIRGSAPLQLRERFRSALERIREEKADELAHFAGDSSEFESTRQYLEECLVVQRKPREYKVSAPLKVLLLVIGILLVVGSVWWVRDWVRWSRYVERLEREPGIVVLRAKQNLGGYSISGLRDPLAIDPAQLLRGSGLDISDVTAQWEPYFALDHRMVETRVRSVLSPPATVSLRIEGSVLILQGAAEHSWISGMKQLVKFLPYISEVLTDRLIDLDIAELKRTEAEMEAEVIRFEPGSAQLTAAEKSELNRKVERMRSWFGRAEQCGLQPRLTVVGHSDPSGGEATNRRLSRERAENVRIVLIGAGLDASRIVPIGAGTTEPVLGPEAERKHLNRSCTLRLETGGHQ